MELWVQTWASAYAHMHAYIMYTCIHMQTYAYTHLYKYIYTCLFLVNTNDSWLQQRMTHDYNHHGSIKHVLMNKSFYTKMNLVFKKLKCMFSLLSC
jgi:hypothetical protein